LVRRLLGRQEEGEEQESRPSPQVQQLEARFREALSTKVQLRRKGTGGRLVIFFYSEEELAAIYDHIVGE
jgi:ParB family chromosome partitioning protein